MTFRIKVLNVTNSITNTQRNNALHNAECRYAEYCVLFIGMLSFIMLKVIMLSVIMLNIIMLNVFMLNVIMLNVC
jgi:hypothetical protein